MRKIAIVGVDAESETVECEIADSGEKLALPLDDTFRAAARGRFGDSAEVSVDADSGDAPAADPTEIAGDTTDISVTADSSDTADTTPDSEPAGDSESETRTGAALPATPEPSLTTKNASADDGGDADSLAAVSSVRPEPGGKRPSVRQAPERSAMRPKDLQARVRAGATVEELCESTGMSFTRVEAFAYPILQERGAKAETARKAHPLLADGPSIDTVEQMVRDSLEERGIDPEVLRWDSWRLKSGNWTVQANWPAGLSDDASALWEFVPDSHGGVAHPLDDEAVAIGDPELRKPLGIAEDSANGADTAYDDAHNTPADGGYSGDLAGAHYGPTNGQWARTFPASVTGIGGRRVPHDPQSQPAPFVLGRPIELDSGAGTAAGTGARPGGAGAPDAASRMRRDSAAEPPTESSADHSGAATAAEKSGSADKDHDDEFLMHPPTEGGAHRSKGRHPTMPSWEDVLLGVRSPKDSK